LFSVLLLTALGCWRGGAPSTPSLPSIQHRSSDPARVEAPGLHNVFRLADNLYSGSSPDDDEGFRSLRKLGVQTVVSVDGARPDLARARRFGLRYVHLPIGYDGVPQQQAMRIAKAVRDLPGPVYVHCHHGKHRGPAAAAVVHLCLDDKCAVEAAVAWLRQVGTDPRYTGLNAAPRQLRRPTAEELDRVPADFPEVVEVSGLSAVMVGVDKHWEHLQVVRAAGWKTPPNHADLEPPHEALQLLEAFREAARLPGVADRTEEFRRWLADAEAGAGELEQALRNRKGKEAVDGSTVEKAFRNVGMACTRCHLKYRDVPQAP
jgi:protein tyrosine phosphatase (PTP) superfamily phosphohydrolase (DUF442 family)